MKRRGILRDYYLSIDERDGLSTKKFTQVRQEGEFNWASQLQPSSQKISLTVMSRPESIMIR